MKRARIQKRVGVALRARREALGISQEKFAELVQMHRTYYSAIERGLKNLKIETLERLCLAMKARTWEVLKDADA